MILTDVGDPSASGVCTGGGGRVGNNDAQGKEFGTYTANLYGLNTVQRNSCLDPPIRYLGVEANGISPPPPGLRC